MESAAAAISVWRPGEESGEEVEEELGETLEGAVLPLPPGERPADWAPARRSEETVPLLL